MLVIRFRRTGKKNKPTYRIVVAEHSWPVDGKFTADLGFYNPHTKQTNLNGEEVKTWLNKGAQPSNSVAKVMVKEKIKHNSVVVVKKNRKPRNAQEEQAVPVEAANPAEASPEIEATISETEQSADQSSDTASVSAEG